MSVPYQRPLHVQDASLDTRRVGDSASTGAAIQRPSPLASPSLGLLSPITGVGSTERRGPATRQD